METDTHKSLLHLNDDCLIEVFNYLSLEEIFNVIDIQHPRLAEIAHQKIASIKHLNIEIREFPNFTSKQLRIIGENLRSFTMTVGYSIPTITVFNILEPLCEGAALTNQLREFKLNYVYINKHLCDFIGKAAHNLEKVDLSYCQLTDELLIEFLKQCTNLIELHIFGNYTLRGNFLRNCFMPNMRILKLEMHADWSFPIEEFVIEHPDIQLIII
ncbi:uncharacterized protein [Eurosta solidaginis]